MHTQPHHVGAMASHELGDGYASGVSWGAVFAGAAAAAALSFILLILGMGLGLSSVSPYQYNATPLGGAAIAWIAFTQLAAAGIGGYMAGRLRVKWASVHGDEVHFRDTAHGLLAWAVATLITVAVLGGGVRAVLSGAIDSGTAVANAVAPALARDGGRSNSYFADMLLRSPNGDAATDAQRNEINRILLTDLPAGKINADDRSYLAQLIAKRTGLAPADAEQRVDLRRPPTTPRPERWPPPRRRAGPPPIPPCGCSSRCCWALSSPACLPRWAAATAITHASSCAHQSNRRI